MTSSLPHIKARKLRALAVTTKERSEQFPDIPADAESYAGYESTGWSALSAPAGISAEIVEEIEHMIQVALQNEKVRGPMMGQGTMPTFMGSRELTAKVKADLHRYEKWFAARNCRSIDMVASVQ